MGACYKTKGSKEKNALHPFIPHTHIHRIRIQVLPSENKLFHLQNLQNFSSSHVRQV